MQYRRVVVTTRGGPEVLRMEEAPLPEPAPGEARVRIMATGVSFADLLMREGIHPEARRPPYVLGWELVGRVDALGSEANGIAVGQLVGALPVVGGYAEYLCLPVAELIPVPEGLDPAEVVCLLFNYMTAYQLLHRSARAREGEAALILSAAGGIGTALIQLGQVAGLQLYGAASPRKHGLVARLGATPVDGYAADRERHVRAISGGGVNMVFDGVGGASLLRSYRMLRPGGRVIAYGLAAGLRGGRSGVIRVGAMLAGYLAAFALNLLPDQRRVRLYSIQLLKRRHPDWYRQDLAQLFNLLAHGKIAPLVAARLPLADAPLAHRLLGSGDIVGKIILLPG